MADTTTSPKTSAASSPTNGRPKRAAIQDDFTPRSSGRTSQTLEIWAPEMDDLSKTLPKGKVAIYPDVDPNVATALRKNYGETFEIKLRKMTKTDDGKNVGQLEIKKNA